MGVHFVFVSENPVAGNKCHLMRRRHEKVEKVTMVGRHRGGEVAGAGVPILMERSDHVGFFERWAEDVFEGGGSVNF